MDEIKLLDNKRTLNSYELILTEDCNLRCKYCFDDSYSDRTGCSYNYVMPLEMVDEIINFIEKTKNTEIKTRISFFGGEPTLNWAFIEKFIETAKEKHIRSYEYSINTNTISLTTERIDYLIQNRVSFIISLDGTKESHDKNRVFKNKQGSWDDVTEKLPEIISKCKRNRVGVSFLMVVTPETCEFIEKNYLFLISLGGPVNILWNYNAIFSEEQFKKIENQLYNLFIKKKVIPYVDLQRRVLDKRSHSQKNYCHQPDTNVTISPKGDLFFCHRLVPKMSEDLIENNPESYGNIYQGYLNKDYVNKINFRTNKDLFKIGKKCERCPALPFCKGGCIGAVRNGTGNYEDFLPAQCRINTILAKLFLKN